MSFQIDGNNLRVLAKDFTLCSSVVLHKLISIVFHLMIQIKWKFPAKSYGARAIFLNPLMPGGNIKVTHT